MDSDDDFTNHTEGPLFERECQLSCNPFPNCQNVCEDTFAQSYVPFNTVLDPISNELVSVLVLPTGEIKLFAYLYDSMSHPSLHLEGPSSVESNLSPPSEGFSLYQYDMRTFYAPKVVCREDVPSAFNGFNCLLAWVDRGIPLGNVLYTYFKVDASGTYPAISWHGNVYVLPFSKAVGHLSAGAFYDLFWLTYKSATGTTDAKVEYVVNSMGSRTNWGLPSDISSSGVIIDSPTWATNGDGNEAALMWTQVPE